MNEVVVTRLVLLPSMANTSGASPAICLEMYVVLCLDTIEMYVGLCTIFKKKCRPSKICTPRRQKLCINTSECMNALPVTQMSPATTRVQ